MVLSLILENEGKTFIHGVIAIDQIVADANKLFLEHQVSDFLVVPTVKVLRIRLSTIRLIFIVTDCREHFFATAHNLI